MIEDLTFLEEGEFTKRNGIVQATANGIACLADSYNSNYCTAICEYISKNFNVDDLTKKSEFRKRTASQILESMYVIGCTDPALAFLVLARALGFKAAYVETFDAAWLTAPDFDKIQGHVFVNVLVGKSWKVYNPKTGPTENNNYCLNGNEYVGFGLGLDFSQLYIRNHKTGIYSLEPVNLQNFDNLPDLLKQNGFF